jgi:hypothetical protein
MRRRQQTQRSCSTKIERPKLSAGTCAPLPNLQLILVSGALWFVAEGSAQPRAHPATACCTVHLGVTGRHLKPRNEVSAASSSGPVSITTPMQTT